MGPAYSLNNETDIMYDIYHYGPVQGEQIEIFSIETTYAHCSLATMWVYPDFFVYRTGIYRHSQYGSPNEKGFHSVRLVGWGEEGENKYWVSKKIFLDL